MKTVNPMAATLKGEMSFDKLEMSGRKVPLSKGSSPKASMVDGPYGGKKPQS